MGEQHTPANLLAFLYVCRSQPWVAVVFQQAGLCCHFLWEIWHLKWQGSWTVAFTRMAFPTRPPPPASSWLSVVSYVYFCMWFIFTLYCSGRAEAAQALRWLWFNMTLHIVFSLNCDSVARILCPAEAGATRKEEFFLASGSSTDQPIHSLNL